VSQPEGFLITITTQSERAPSGVFLSELRKARAVRDGTLAAPILPILYEFPPGVAWEDPANWPMVTPNQGRSVSIDRLIPDHDAARAAGDAELRRWASQHLNVEIGVALLADAWAGADYWEAQAEPGITLETLIARSEVVTIGVDGGGLDDLLGLAVLGREKGTGRWLAWCRAWAHPVVLRRRQGEAARLRDFAADGDLRLVEQIGDDMAELVALVVQLRDARLLPKKHGIGIDPGNSHAVVDALTASDFEQEQMAAVSQGWRLGGAIKLTERRLAEGTLWHAGQPLMAWCVGNAKVEPKGNAMLITKQASGTAKIDPLMALFNAAELMARAPEPEPRSFYDDPEFMRISFGGSANPEDDDEERGWRRVW
jgi:phage terminase large subunit-like protein